MGICVSMAFLHQSVNDFGGTGEQKKIKVSWFPSLLDQIQHFIQNGTSMPWGPSIPLAQGSQSICIKDLGVVDHLRYGLFMLGLQVC